MIMDGRVVRVRTLAKDVRIGDRVYVGTVIRIPGTVTGFSCRGVRIASAACIVPWFRVRVCRP